MLKKINVLEYLERKQDIEQSIANKYMIIDRNKKEIYYYIGAIEQGFSLDMLLDYYERYEINYKLYYYNNGKVIVIR